MAGNKFIAVDSEVFGKLLRPENHAATIECLQESCTVLCVPLPVLDEQLQSIINLIRLSGLRKKTSRIRFLKLDSDVWDREFLGGILQPILSPKSRFKFLDRAALLAEANGSLMGEFRAKVKSIKHDLSERFENAKRDVKTNPDFRGHFDEINWSDIVKTIESDFFQYLERFKWMAEGFCRKSLPSIPFEQLVKRHRSLFIYTGLTVLTINGTHLPAGMGAQNETVRMLGRHKNDPYDTFIATSAAYCDKFLTFDKKLQWKCELLRRSGVSTFHSVSPVDVGLLL